MKGFTVFLLVITKLTLLWWCKLWPTLNILINDLCITTSNICNTMPHKHARKTSFTSVRVSNEMQKKPLKRIHTAARHEAQHKNAS